ncbi:hypothetical protein ACHAQH_004607 [Verticillium albo-atrum]
MKVLTYGLNGSEYFKKALEGKYEESKPQEFDLTEELSPEDLGNYVSAAYGAAIIGQGFNFLEFHSPALSDRTMSTKLKLWRTCHFFENRHISSWARTCYLFDVAVEKERLEQKAFIENFVDAYNTCDEMPSSFSKEYLREGLITDIALSSCEKAMGMFTQNAPGSMIQLLLVQFAKQRQIYDDAKRATVKASATSCNSGKESENHQDKKRRQK